MARTKGRTLHAAHGKLDGVWATSNAHKQYAVMVTAAATPHTNRR